MSVESIGKMLREASDRMDETWKKMREHFVKMTKQVEARRELNPDVLGNQTDAAIRAKREKEIELTPKPSESLASAIAECETRGQWRKV